MNKLPRPTIRDEAIIAAAVDQSWAQIAEWFDGELEDPAEAKREVVEAIRHAFTGDAYEVARELDRAGWDADLALVEILDSVCHGAYAACIRAVKAWVQTHGIAPSLSVGARVNARALNGHTGVIHSLEYAERGEYLVFCAALGHGKLSDGGGVTRGLILPFEDVTAVERELINTGAPSTSASK